MSGENETEELTLVSIPQRCGLDSDQIYDLGVAVKLFSPVVLGVLASVGLSVVAGLISLSPLALGFIITAAVIAFLGGIAGSVAVLIDGPAKKPTYFRVKDAVLSDATALPTSGNGVGNSGSV